MIQSNERATTLIVVLIAMSFIAFLSLILVEYGIWHSRLGSVNHDLVHLHQAQRLAESRTRSYLKETLPDSPVITQGKKLEWTLPPKETKVRVTIHSLNSKINLNRFKETSAGETFKDLVKSILEELNYPNRTMRELARWIVSEQEQSGLGQGPYGGYRYSAPKRKILHLDEIQLISGFKQIGLKDQFRTLFTVYGSGDINPLHFSPDQWKLVQTALSDKLPRLPPSALQSNKSLRTYLNREDVWGEISEAVPFLKKKDNSFRVDFQVVTGTTRIRRRAILRFNYEKESVKLETRYPVPVPAEETET